MSTVPKEKSQATGGLAILAVIVVLSAGWIGREAKRLASQATAAPVLLELKDAPGLIRFRDDAWYLPKETLLGFVEIPGGNFVMGSDPRVDAQAFSNERWSAASFQGTLLLPTFYVGRYEVTVAQFRAFVAATGYRADEAALLAPADFPVTHVSWTDALAYSRWLTAALKNSALTSETIAKLLRDGWQITLPTEAQWEKAARGSDGRIYPWGNAPSAEHANFGAAAAKAVGSMPCADCAFGLYDMSGNVWELTRSANRPYPFELSNPNGDLGSDALFVMRGGSYQDREGTIRAATRGGIDPGARRDFIGFRVVLTPP